MTKFLPALRHCLLPLALLCARCGPPQGPADPDLLATYDGGEIRVRDLDAALLARPRSEQPPEDAAGTRAWMRRHLIRLFEDRVLLEPQARLALQQDEAFLKSWPSRSRQVLTEAYLRKHMPAFSVTDEDLRAGFETLKPRARMPERRLLSNLLLAFEPGATEAQRQRTCQEAANLRAQVLAGASFEELARLHSDSATASNGGAVGMVARDHLRPEAAEAVFSLDSGGLSQVITTESGCQFFWVQNVVPAVEPALEGLRGQVRASILEQRRQEWLSRHLAEKAAARGATIPRWPENGLPEGFGPESIFLKEFDGGFTGRKLLDLVQAGRPPQAAFTQLTAETVLDSAMRQDHPQEAEAALAPEREAFEAQFLRRRALQEQLQLVPDEELQRHFKQRESQFVADQKLELTVYSWPIRGADPLEATRIPGRFAEALRKSGDRSQEAAFALAEETQAQRQVIPLARMRSIGRQRPELARALFENLGEGDIIGPYRAGSRLLVVVVDLSIPSRALGFLEARPQVLASYGLLEQPALQRRWSEDLQRSRRFELFEANLDSFGQRLLTGIVGSGP